MLDSACLDLAIAKPNLLINTDLLIIIWNYLSLICKTEILYLPHFYLKHDVLYLFYGPWKQYRVVASYFQGFGIVKMIIHKIQNSQKTAMTWNLSDSKKIRRIDTDCFLLWFALIVISSYYLCFNLILIKLAHIFSPFDGKLWRLRSNSCLAIYFKVWNHLGGMPSARL